MIFTNRKSDENGLPKAFTALSPHIDRVAVWPSIVSVAEFSAEKLMNDLKGQFNIKADQEKDWMRGLNRIESNIGFLCSDTLKAEYISDRAKDILKEEMKNSGSFAYALNQIESRPVKTPKP
jgi:hypothetical protein